MINHGTFEVTETSKFVDGSTWKDSTRGDNWLVTSPSKDFSSLAMKQKADFKVNACHILLNPTEISGKLLTSWNYIFHFGLRM